MPTEKQIQLVKKSWSLLINVDPVLLGDVFYRKLFIDDPSVKSMFHTERSEQAKKLVDMLSMIVLRLHKLDTIEAEIIAMAKRHVGYGTTAKHYDEVGAALLWTLQQALRDEWNEELEEAWKTCYGHLAKLMIDATKTN